MRLLPPQVTANVTSTCPLDQSLWHCHFCHLNKSDVQKVIKGDYVTGVTVTSSAHMEPLCEPCLASKQHRVSVPKIAQHRATKPLELIHSDVHGPLPIQSRHHYRYFITFIDDYSRFWFVAPLKDKAGAFTQFKRFKALAENQLGGTIKALRDDKGGEYMSNEWQAFCNDAGIRRQHTIRAEPHQNGVAEQANHTIIEHAIALLNEANLPGSFWWDTVAAYTHVRNRSPSASLPSNKMPYEL